MRPAGLLSFVPRVTSLRWSFATLGIQTLDVCHLSKNALAGVPGSDQQEPRNRIRTRRRSARHHFSGHLAVVAPFPHGPSRVPPHRLAGLVKKFRLRAFQRPDVRLAVILARVNLKALGMSFGDERSSLRLPALLRYILSWRRGANQRRGENQTEHHANCHDSSVNCCGHRSSPHHLSTRQCSPMLRHLLLASYRKSAVCLVEGRILRC